MDKTLIEDIAKNIVRYRQDAKNKELHLHVRLCYQDFARHGEEIIIHEADKIIAQLRWRR